MVFFFDGWDGVMRVIVIAPCAHAALVAFLRTSGKRTLTQLIAFDLVITVSLGSVLATQVLSKDTPLLDGITAMALLIALQWVVAFASVRSHPVRKLVRSEPTMLVDEGATDAGALRRHRRTEDELLQAIRASGHCAVFETRFVFLQSDGSLAVIAKGQP